MSGRSEGKPQRSLLKELPVLLLVAVVLAVVVKTFLVQPFFIPSASMEQTLHGCPGCTADRILVTKPPYWFSDPQPGDVVVFEGPASWPSEAQADEPTNWFSRAALFVGRAIGVARPSDRDFVKRVVAVGGQTVQCCDDQGRVTVDGRPLDEPYLYQDDQRAFGPVTLEAGQLWVMGDHRSDSADSRDHGPIDVDDVNRQGVGHRLAAEPVRLDRQPRHPGHDRERPGRSRHGGPAGAGAADRPAAPVRAAVGALVAVAVAVLAGCSGGLEATPPGEVIPVADRDPAPEVGGGLVGGGTLEPTVTAGVVTVVNFWGSWCGPCRVEVPELQQIADAHPEVAVVGVDLRDQEQFAQAFLDEQGITYPSVHDPAGELAAAFAAWPVTQTPSTVVIDAEGLVAAAYSGPVTAADLERALDRLD